MIYEFKSLATGTIVMTQDNAEKLLKVIDKQPGATGIITVDQMPAAIAALQNDLPTETAAETESTDPADNDEESDGDSQPVVSLRQRALPLIEMMQTAHKAGKDITWGV
ncbi:MAG: DUF1840 domain-containing protein [Burkholderiaceae bacterium]